MAADQQRAPLLEALLEYAARNPAVFHVPGHKRGRGAAPLLKSLLGSKALAADLTESYGLDNLHAPEGPILEAQQLAAAAFGARRSFFLVNGSTAGLQALILATCRSGQKLIVPRHAHRSVVAGLILSGAHPVWAEPEWHPALDIPLTLPAPTLAAALATHSDAAAVLLVHPTYEGLASSVAELVAMSHRAGLPVLVDEAHGTHFALHPAFPAPALAGGADAAVQSWHKTGGSLTQSSVLHLGGPGRVDPARVAAALQMVQTASPSYLLLASLDAARRQMALNGRRQWDRTIQLAAATRRRLATLPGIRVPDLPAAGADPTRLVISVAERGLTGPQAARSLWEQASVAVEMAGSSHVVVLLTPGDGPAQMRRLVEAVRALPWGEASTRVLGPPPLPEVVLTPRQASFLGRARVPLQAARGRVAAETVVPYPPGIPVLTPGERIGPATLDYLRGILNLGLAVHGLEAGTVAVIRE